MPQVPNLKDVSVPVLERYLRRLFALHDTDNNGVLDQKEFAKLLEKSGLGFTKKLIRKLLIEADANEDGVIQYEEYLPVMLEIIRSSEVTKLKKADDAAASQQAVDFILTNMTEEQLERAISKEFMRADADNNGYLDRSEFIACMRDMDFGLTKKEILYLMAEVDINQDGKVQYEEFVPVAIGIITQIIKDKILESSSRLDLQGFFLETFSNYDTTGEGTIAVSNVRDALSAIGLSTIQVQTILAEATTDAGGLVKYRSLSRVAAQMFSDFFTFREGGDVAPVTGGDEVVAETEPMMEAEELERYLRQLFYQADVESNGYLHPRDFGQLLRSSGLGFSSKTIRRVIEEADVDNNGRIDYLEYVSSMAQIIRAQEVKNKYETRAWEDEARARAAATEFILQGVSRDWLERSMHKMFMTADINNSGTLDTAEFISCLRRLDLGLTRKEITFVMSECDANQDGLISYQEFVPLCFDLLVELIKDKFLEDHGALRLQEYLVDILKEYDHKGSGKISLSQLREALSLSSLGLTAIQVQAIVSEARQDAGGLITYQPFSRAAAMMVSDMLGESIPAVAQDSTGPLFNSLQVGNVLPSTSLTPEVDSMVARYEGDYEAVKARSLASTPGLRGKLSDLASQLARVQDENDSIRQRYLELEDAWTVMGDENGAMRKRISILEGELREKSSALATSQELNRTLDDKLRTTHHNFVDQRNLAEDTKQTLISEQIELGKKSKESMLLRRESMTQESELRQLREAWNEREARLQRLEEQRGFYEQQLSQLGEAYQAMVDKLSFVVQDHGVRSAPLQMRVGGGYELLSNYLDKVFTEQDDIALKYKASGSPMSPYVPQQFPMSVTPTKPVATGVY